MVPLILNSCAVSIKNEQFCSPIPGGLGSVCDDMLDSNQLVLTQDEWVSKQIEWQSEGQAVECTSSNTIGDFKIELEQLCSVTQCNYNTQAIINALDKIKTLGVYK